MATINDITKGSSYTGNAALGGFGGKAIKIDSRPLELLANYTFLYNKSQYDQRQKDADEKIKELAAITALDLNGARPEDREKVLAPYEQLMKDAAARASESSPKSPREKAEQKLKFDLKVKETIDAINAVNARGISYTTQLKEITDDTTIDAKQKDIKIKQLNKLFNETDIKAPIPKLEKFKMTIPEIGKAPVKTVETVVEGANGTVSTTVSFTSLGNLLKAGDAKALDLSIPELPPNATATQKYEYELKKASIGTNKIWQDAAQQLNTAISDPKYKKEDGTIDIESIKVDIPFAGELLEYRKRWNDYAAKGKNDLQAGMFTDKVGNKLNLINVVTNDDFIPLDENKPLTGGQLVALQMFADAAPDKKEVTYQYTGMGNAIKLKQMDEAGANFRKKLEVASKGTGTGATVEVIDRPAVLFGQHIQRAKDYFKENGNKDFVVPYSKVDDKTRVAAKLAEGDFIIYKPNGSYVVSSDKDGTTVKGVGTIENLAQGFIDAVKTIDLSADSKDGAMAEGFQIKSENKFKEIFGTTSGQSIWDNWDKATGTENNQKQSSGAKTYKGLDANGNPIFE